MWNDSVWQSAFKHWTVLFREWIKNWLYQAQKWKWYDNRQKKGIRTTHLIMDKLSLKIIFSIAILNQKRSFVKTMTTHINHMCVSLCYVHHICILPLFPCVCNKQCIDLGLTGSQRDTPERQTQSKREKKITSAHITFCMRQDFYSYHKWFRWMASVSKSINTLKPAVIR